MADPRCTRELDHLAQLDGIRGVAVALVLLMHCFRFPDDGTLAWGLRHVFAIGWVGVDLFFALSGFLITRILLRTRDSSNYFSGFYARRALRIFPVYYALLFFFWLGGDQWLFGSRFEPAWPYFSYVSNYFIVFSTHDWRMLGHTWSLAVEEQFYLVFPLLVWWLSTASLRRLLVGVIVASPLVRLAFYQTWPESSHFLTICRLDALAFGALSALELETMPDRLAALTPRMRRLLPWLGLVLAVLWVSQQLDFKSVLMNLVGLSLVDFSAALVVLLTATSALPTLTRFMTWRPLALLGRISYGAYLIHFPVFFFVLRQVGPHFQGWTRTAAIAACSLGVSIGLAALSWRFFESPVLGLKRFFNSKSAPGILRETAASKGPAT